MTRTQRLIATEFKNAIQVIAIQTITATRRRRWSDIPIAAHMASDKPLGSGVMNARNKTVRGVPSSIIHNRVTMPLSISMSPSNGSVEIVSDIAFELISGAKSRIGVVQVVRSKNHPRN
jgi:hypothetical protein